MKKEIKSFYGLKLFAFLNVFLLHVSSYKITSFYNNAAWAVSFFIMVSGFLYGYKYMEKEVKIKDSLSFFCEKVIKIYPLYFFATFSMLPFSSIMLDSIHSMDFSFSLKNFIYNILLLQS